MGSNSSKEVILDQALKLEDQNFGELGTAFLRRLGLLYKEESPDKFSLIKSAACLNAAIVAQPLNHQNKKILNQLCSIVLKSAKAKYVDADLCSIASDAISNVHKTRRNSMEALRKLQNLPPDVFDTNAWPDHGEILLDHMRKFHSEMTELSVDLMKSIGDLSVKILGEPPCLYSITGLGSLAAKGVFRFSAFPLVILLEDGIQENENYPIIVEYFRWVSVLFHILVINFKETRLNDSVLLLGNNTHAPIIDWFEDSCKSCEVHNELPLYATIFPRETSSSSSRPFKIELINTLSEMKKVVEVEEEIYHEFRFTDALRNIHFLSGCKNIHDEFQRHIEMSLPREILLEMEYCRRTEVEAKLMKLEETIEELNALNTLQLSHIDQLSQVLAMREELASRPSPLLRNGNQDLKKIVRFRELQIESLKEELADLQCFNPQHMRSRSFSSL